MHVYAFGSVCRGEFDRGSDVDLLACVDVAGSDIDTEKYSVYQYEGIKRIWSQGSPFAWHLHIESRLIYSSDGLDFIRALGAPSRYQEFRSDYAKFRALFQESYDSLVTREDSCVFSLSCVFLAVRNIATCYSVAIGSPVFSRNSPFKVCPALDISEEAFSVLMRSRLLSTRGYGSAISPEDARMAAGSLGDVLTWMDLLLEGVGNG